jgi:hypothetical protein
VKARTKTIATAAVEKQCAGKLRRGGTPMVSLLLVCFLSLSALFNGAQEEAQVPSTHPKLIEGPWEVTGASGIDGIFLSAVTGSTGPPGREKFDWQAVDIRVYHRAGGKETWGYFSARDKATPQSYNMGDDHSFMLFDGERLLIHFVDTTDLKPFDLDIHFASASAEWSGTWLRSGQKSQVVLRRPVPGPKITPSAFVGDWTGESRRYMFPGSLHIRQSSDRVLSVWLDRTLSGMDPKTGSIHNDQRNGEWLKVDSAADAELLFETTNPVGPPYQFRASLSEDRQMLKGTWEGQGGGRLSAPETFRKIP